MRAADRDLRDQVKTWERYTNEKADVARNLMVTVRSLLRDTLSNKKIRSLSIGSSDEPQFQVLHALSNGGLWLYDLDADALDILRERTRRLFLSDVHLEQGDYLADFLSEETAKAALETRFDGIPFDLITFHHALYYCSPEDWPDLLRSICLQILNAPGTLHLALMSSKTEQPYTTTWLYNRFAQKFFSTRNSQDLLQLPSKLRSMPGMRRMRYSTDSRAVRCRPQSFDDLMAVVWMILLYPHVHDFSADHRAEITEFVLDAFWLAERDLVQIQDYVTIAKIANDPPG